ncbi:carboxypeptidase-like regulatory domain-containing protein [Hymenobacter latericus]|uniref:carboxypeptidase-like regulatory domain-containing protein n=1 Tax=Hymenobacter sp. YIM 151858-1 TaxID=2987688 RepID=UPI002226FB8B|nr:carboxypeptidase-like regulatory domain-containing protein [Hymenobacter sp. YIM 151858-1]UYZ57400.1 carboxypeptidase-like regulatory domain-containing protein [Hymenobacter sp. YIM 151858-1]
MQAQIAQITGRIVGRADNQPLPRATIIEKGTTNGTLSTSDGHFELSTKNISDSLTLTVSNVGFDTRFVQVAPDSYTEIALDSSRIPSHPRPHTFWGSFSLLPGLSYAPFGADLRLFTRMRGFKYPIGIGFTYQSNVHRNHFFRSTLSLPNWSRNGRFFVSSNLERQWLQIVPANLHFISYTGTIGLLKYRIGPWFGPWLHLTAGYAAKRFISDATGFRIAGLGYGAGLSHEFRPFFLRLGAEARFLRWPGYWQLQGQVLHSLDVSRRFRVGLAAHSLLQYREVSVIMYCSF